MVSGGIFRTLNMLLSFFFFFSFLFKITDRKLPVVFFFFFSP